MSEKYKSKHLTLASHYLKKEKGYCLNCSSPFLYPLVFQLIFYFFVNSYNNEIYAILPTLGPP
jgi:hypothetical protein